MAPRAGATGSGTRRSRPRLAPRIGSMPAGFTSAKFVGRESAFARLAPALEATAAGLPTTILVEGTGGIGVSRFLTEASSRVTALAEPFTVLRSRAASAGDDEPYAPILRAIRPTLLAASDEELADLLGPGVEDGLRLLPELHTRLAHVGALPDHPTVTSPERRQARLLVGIPGVMIRRGFWRASSACSSGSASGSRWPSCSRTSTTPTPGPGPSRRSWPASSDRAGSVSSQRSSPTRSPGRTRSPMSWQR